MGDLAASLHGKGKHAEAEQMQRELLEVKRRVLGPEHPDTMDTMANLAHALDGEDKHAEAEQMQRELLDLQRRVLGPEHLDTLSTMSNLADSLGGQVKHVEEKQIPQDGVQMREPRTSSAPRDPHPDAPLAKRVRR